MGIAFAGWTGPVPTALRPLTMSVTERTCALAYRSDCSVLVLGAAAPRVRGRVLCACDLDHFGGTVSSWTTSVQVVEFEQASAHRSRGHS